MSKIFLVIRSLEFGAYLLFGAWVLKFPVRSTGIRSFGSELESRELSAQNYLTSELLRTL